MYLELPKISRQTDFHKEERMSYGLWNLRWEERLSSAT